jgi:hypothetical protein
MRRFRISFLALALAAVGLAACTSGQPEPAASTAERTCVKVRQINSFTALDDRHVLVKASVSTYSLFTVDQTCSGLSFARGIAIAEAGSRVCDDGFDFLAFEHPAAGPRRCRIMKIEPVEDEEAARALLESRAAGEQARAQ